MATVIDSLVVELGLDPKKFTEGQRAALASFKKTQEEGRKGAKEIEETARRNAETMSAATTKVLGFVAAWAGLGAIQRYVQNITAADAATGRAARTIGTSEETLARWQGALERVGGAAGEMAGFMTGLVQQFHTMSQTGQGGEFIRWFRAIGVEVADETGRLRDWNTILQEVNKALQTQTPAAAETFLRNLSATPGVARLLSQPTPDLARLLSEQTGLGLPTPTDTRQAAEMQKAWLDLAQATTSLVREISRDFLPPLIEFLRWSAEMIKYWRGDPETQARLRRQNERTGTGAFIRDTAGTPDDVDRAIGLPIFTTLRRWLSVDNGPEAGAGAGAGTTPRPTLRIKPGAGQASPPVQRLAEQLQNEIPGLNRFTSFNDALHAGRPSAHNQGRALDFTLNDPGQAAAVAQQIRSRLAAMGINATVIDEYSRPSFGSTGGHIHVQFNTAADAQRFGAAGTSVNQALTQAPMQGSGVPFAGMGMPMMGGGNQTRTNTVQIGTMVIQTQATDADGIMRAARGALERNNFATQANDGPNG